MNDQVTVDRIFHALSDSTRRAILRTLAQHPAPVSELARPFSISLAAVSKHIKILESAQLVTKEREGRTIRCRINVHPLDEAERTIRELHDHWNARLDELDTYLRRSVQPTDDASTPSAALRESESADE